MQHDPPATCTRRTFLGATATTLACGFAATAAAAPGSSADDARRRGRDLVGQFGVTTGSFVKHLASKPTPGKLFMLDLPKIMRDELDLQVIDLMTATLPYTNADYCAQFRDAAEKAGRTITNLKLNLAEAEIGSSDEAVRSRALAGMKQGIDAAERLGCRWVRPATTGTKPDRALLVAGLRELSDYAAPKQITLLVENNGWIKGDAEALPEIVAAVGQGIAVQPDTGNWNPATRFEGLAKAFPLAVSCDFKAIKLGPDGEHPEYDLRKCFDIAWQAGFRGPWCFEHFDASLPQLFKNLIWLREQITAWTKEQGS